MKSNDSEKVLVRRRRRRRRSSSGSFHAVLLNLLRRDDAIARTFRAPRAANPSGFTRARFRLPLIRLTCCAISVILTTIYYTPCTELAFATPSRSDVFLLLDTSKRESAISDKRYLYCRLCASYARAVCSWRYRCCTRAMIILSTNNFPPWRCVCVFVYATFFTRR